MARATLARGQLVACPTCGTDVVSADIGLRDFAWVNQALPGRVGGMDLDFLITQAGTDRALVLEMKPMGATLSLGARLTFALLRRKGMAVWMVWDQFNGNVQLAQLDKEATVGDLEEMTQAELADRIAEWWNRGVR